VISSLRTAINCGPFISFQIKVVVKQNYSQEDLTDCKGVPATRYVFAKALLPSQPPKFLKGFYEDLHF